MPPTTYVHNAVRDDVEKRLREIERLKRLNPTVVQRHRIEIHRRKLGQYMQQGLIAIIESNFSHRNS